LADIKQKLKIQVSDHQSNDQWYLLLIFLIPK
jgi:hypothetical protein